jgi:ArsR family transcriptional regulator
MERLVQLAKVFSDINRLKILVLVLRHTNICVCEICDTLELSQPLVSRHLKQMKESNILESQQEGKWVIYSLAKSPDPILKCWMREVQQEFSSLPNLVSCNKI